MSAERKILVADDDVVIRQAIARTLRGAGSGVEL